MSVTSASRATTASVCAVVVTYRPGSDVPGHIRALLRQVDRVVVVDNETTPESKACLAPVASEQKVELVENRENLGIAAAFNQGIARAQRESFEWIATFDQDSHAPDGYFAALVSAHAGCPERERVAVMAPCYRDRYLGFVYSAAKGPVQNQKAGAAPVRVTASSGNLVSLAALRAIGGFREDFFMACVDFEFCLRCRKAGWQVLEVADVILDHAMGRYRQHRWLWLDVRVNDYDASRRYYQARNLLILYASCLLFDPYWVARNAWFYGRDLLKLVLFGEDRGLKLRAIATGWWHAIIGRRGRWALKSGQRR